MITEIVKKTNHPEKLKDSTGEGGQRISKKVAKTIAPFSEELLAHRCGISDVIITKKSQTFCKTLGGTGLFKKLGQNFRKFATNGLSFFIFPVKLCSS